MKNKIMYLAFAGVLVMPALAFAATFKASDNASLPAGEVLRDDLYIAGSNVTSAGTVEGDIMAAGGSLLVQGPIKGDAALAGGNISVMGDVADDLRAGGGNIIVTGSVGGDIIMGGGQINISGPRVGGDLVVGGGTIYVNTPVAGNARIAGGKITFGPKAVIEGTLTYTSKNKAVFESGSLVKGVVTFHEQNQPKINTESVRALFGAFAFLKFLMLLVGSLVIAYVFKRYSREVVELAARQPLREMGRGFLFLAVTPIVSVLLLVTVIGIPFGILGLIAFLAVGIFAWLLTPIIIGSIAYQKLFKTSGFQVDWKTVLLGAVLLGIIGKIPFIGGLAWFVAILLSWGVLSNIKMRLIKEWR